MKRFLGFVKAVEKSRFGPLGWCRWLAVSRSFFFYGGQKISLLAARDP
jgi:hypothetical protein